MEYDGRDTESLFDLVDNLGGVDLPIIDGSEELMNDFKASHEEVHEIYDECVTILTEMNDFYTRMLKMPYSQREPLLVAMTWGRDSVLEDMTDVVIRYNELTDYYCKDSLNVLFNSFISLVYRRGN